MQGSENVVKEMELLPQDILRISSLTSVTLNTLAAGTPVVCVGGILSASASEWLLRGTYRGSMQPMGCPPLPYLR